MNNAHEPAFPGPSDNGLTKLEYFAGQALAGIMASMGHSEFRQEIAAEAKANGGPTAEEVALMAVHYASVLAETLGDAQS